MLERTNPTKAGPRKHQFEGVSRTRTSYKDLIEEQKNLGGNNQTSQKYKEIAKAIKDNYEYF